MTPEQIDKSMIGLLLFIAGMLLTIAALLGFIAARINAWNM